MPECSECKHCDKKWREYSSLPICKHSEADNRGIWAMYATEESGHCGKNKINFEPITYDFNVDSIDKSQKS